MPFPVEIRLFVMDFDRPAIFFSAAEGEGLF